MAEGTHAVARSVLGRSSVRSALGLRVVLAPAHDACRHAGRDRPGGQVACDDRVRADDAAVADRDAGADEDAGAEPDVVADRDVALVAHLLGDVLTRHPAVVGSGHEDLRPEPAVLADRDPADRVAGPEVGALAHLRARADDDPLAVAERDVRRDRRARPERQPPARDDVRVPVVVEQPDDLEPRHRIEERSSDAAHLLHEPNPPHVFSREPRPPGLTLWFVMPPTDSSERPV